MNAYMIIFLASIKRNCFDYHKHLFNLRFFYTSLTIQHEMNKINKK